MTQRHKTARLCGIDQLPHDLEAEYLVDRRRLKSGKAIAKYPSSPDIGNEPGSVMKRMPALLFASVLIVLLAQSASAQERVLTGMGGAPTIIVWKNLRALREGTDLINAGAAKRNPALVTGLISCIVPYGTSAIVTDSTIGTRSILVTSGEYSGCRGSVNVEVIGN